MVSVTLTAESVLSDCSGIGSGNTRDVNVAVVLTLPSLASEAADYWTVEASFVFVPNMLES